MKLQLPKKYIKLAKAAKLCGMKQNSLRVYAINGKLKATKWGRDWVTTKNALRLYLKRRDISKLPKRYKKNKKRLNVSL